jgi:hypothetical protein
MGPAVVLAGLVALSLLLLGATLRRTDRAARRQTPPLRYAVPWIVGGVAVVDMVLVAIPAVPPMVIAGLTVYTGVAVTAIWRMANLDRTSRWMLPSRRRARIAFTAVALVWLGLILGLLLGIADLVARAPSGA